MEYSISDKQGFTVIELHGKIMGGPEATEINDKINQLIDEKKIKIIRLGFDLSVYEKNEPKEKTSVKNNGDCKNPESLRVGIVGRLTPIKNHFMLLEAINYLRN